MLHSGTNDGVLFALFGGHATAVGVFEDEREVTQDPKKLGKEGRKVAAIVLALGTGVHLDVLREVHDEAEVGQSSLVDSTRRVISASIGWWVLLR